MSADWKAKSTTEARRHGETNDNHKAHEGAQSPDAGDILTRSRPRPI